MSQAKQGPCVCPARWMGGTYRRVERKILDKVNCLPLRKDMCSLELHPHAQLLHPQPALAGGSGPAPITYPFCSWVLFSSFLPGPMCLYWLQLQELVGLVHDGRFAFCPEMPKLDPGKARKASLLALSTCLSLDWWFASPFPGLLQWFLTLSFQDKCLTSCKCALIPFSGFKSC